MPYRRLPKSDAARLKALKTLLNNNDIYTVRNRFIDWKTLNRAQPAYDKLFTATEQYRMDLRTQSRNSEKLERPQHNAMMYVSHFLQVLFLCCERGEIKKSQLSLYGLSVNATSLPYLKNAERLIEWGQKVIDGEKARIKKGGRPIYNPTIGMVSTHYDIFLEAYRQQQTLQEHAQQTATELQKIRPEVDEILLELWNQIEKHFEKESPEVRYAECRKFGIIYYNRRNEASLH